MSVEAHANMPGTRRTRVSQHQPQASTTDSGISKRINLPIAVWIVVGQQGAGGGVVKVEVNGAQLRRTAKRTRWWCTMQRDLAEEYVFVQQLQAIALTLQPQHQCSLQRSRCSGTTKDGGMPNRSTTHSDVSPRERLQRGMQPSLTTPNQLASTPSPQILKTAWESTATYGLRCSSPCHFARDSPVQTTVRLF